MSLPDSKSPQDAGDPMPEKAVRNNDKVALANAGDAELLGMEFFRDNDGKQLMENSSSGI